MNILAIIPARAGSKGIKDKNIYPLCGKPLIEWTLEACDKSSLDFFIITTDCEIILSNNGSRLRTRRPAELCRDDSKSIDVIKHALRVFDSVAIADAICLLQPTSPLRTSEDIDNALFLANELENKSNCLYSGHYIGIKHKNAVYNKHTSEKHFQRNGAIFIAKRELIEQGVLWDDTVIEYEMPLSRSIDIDNMDEMLMCEALLEYRAKGGQI
jgi:CMP-N-acetylneuraminic acid synthetase